MIPFPAVVFAARQTPGGDFKERLPEASGKNPGSPAPSSHHHVQACPEGQGREGTAKPIPMINENFKIETDQLALHFTEGRQKQFLVRHEPHRVDIVYPPQTPFDTLQPWLFKVITEALRKQAKAILPARLHELAGRHGFSYSRVGVNAARTRWGSCSSRGHINLSLYLMILPRELSDYVLLHELCHTREMNHGPRFWALMDQVTGRQAQRLRNALRHYPSPFR